MSDQALFAQTRATDSDGNPISGATASFFASGTYTPITIYSDEAATIPLANPVTADANGAFPQVFTTASARCIVRDADGAVVYTLDPVPFARAAATSASATPFEASEDIPKTNVQDAIERVQLNATGAVATLSGSLGSAATKGFLDEDDFASNSATAVPSQQSTKAYIAAYTAAEIHSLTLGAGQTCQDVTASRAGGTSYQNTTGRPIHVSLHWGDVGASSAQASPDGINWVLVGANNTIVAPSGASFVVPAGWYYRTSNTVSIYFWTELR